MSIIIRQARKEDASQASILIYDAIHDIANRLTGETINHNIIIELENLFQLDDNRHSYLNTIVAVEENNTDFVLGILVLYSGKDGLLLDAALQKRLENKKASVTKIDQEAYVDEYYLDTICVDKNSRGLGIGTQLLHVAEKVARQKGYRKLSLNVETEKVSARRLYEKMGYVITETWTIIDEPFYHMVKEIL
nr:GNAT family N-acetyltransferase [Lysinibacillus timonensis]